jgi:hypothetical protein
MTRLSEGVDKDERNAAVLLAQLASAVEDATYYNEHPQLPETTRVLNKAFRVFKDVVTFYVGPDNGLVYTPPDGKFRKQTHN